MNESRTSTTGTIVYIVRDVEERYVQGVFRFKANADAEIRHRVHEMTDEPEGSEEWDYCYEQYEIVEMPLE